MSRGFVTIAQNSRDKNYLEMAYLLGLSIKKTQSKNANLCVMITPGQVIPYKYNQIFDKVIEVPWGDAAEDSDYKIENEWKLYRMTPYEETIGVNADTLFLNDMSHWWDIVSKKDIYFTSNVYNYNGTQLPANSIFEKNTLPHISTAFMYFRKSYLSKLVFHFAELIYQNWEYFSYTYLNDSSITITNDLVFSLALKILDETENCTGPSYVPRITDLKYSKTTLNDWRKLIKLYVDEETLNIKIQEHKQYYPIHYCSDFLDEPRMIKRYGFQRKRDVFFISYNEPNADRNWDLLKADIPWAKRIDGIVGISNAHKVCAELSATEHFWTIDGDNEIIPNVTYQFLMDYTFPVEWADKAINIFYAKNPVNGLEYGWGGIKLWPKSVYTDTNKEYIDFATSFNNIHVVPTTISITRFNTSPFDAWRSGFREAIKLYGKDTTEAKERLDIWRSVANQEEPFADWVKIGANDGIKWIAHNGDIRIINDWPQLETHFKSEYKLNRMLKEKE
jgi:hypothetical protein